MILQTLRISQANEDNMKSINISFTVIVKIFST